MEWAPGAALAGGLAGAWWSLSSGSLYPLQTVCEARPSHGGLRAARKGKCHGKGTFQVLACIPFANVFLVRTCQLANPRVREGPRKSVDRGEAIGGHCCDTLSPNPKQIPNPSVLSIPTGSSRIQVTLVSHLEIIINS